MQHEWFKPGTGSRWMISPVPPPHLPPTSPGPVCPRCLSPPGRTFQHLVQLILVRGHQQG